MDDTVTITVDEYKRLLDNTYLLHHIHPAVKSFTETLEKSLDLYHETARDYVENMVERTKKERAA